jgi:hypothetical protein
VKTLIKKIIRTSMLSILLIFGGLLLFAPNDAVRYDFHHKAPNEEIESYRKYLLNLSDGALGNTEVPIGFRDFPKDSTIAGTCNISLKNMQYEIDINPKMWDYMIGWEKIFLLAHEFIHTCPDDHNTTMMEKSPSCPKYLNHKYLIPVNCLLEHLEYYTGLLKKGCKQDEI